MLYRGVSVLGNSTVQVHSSRRFNSSDKTIRYCRELAAEISDNILQRCKRKEQAAHGASEGEGVAVSHTQISLIPY